MPAGSRPGAVRCTLGALALAVAVSGAGCTAQSGTEPAPAFITPSPPGGSASDRPAGERAEAEATAADLAFVSTMIVHHEQAVELARLAPGRVGDPELAEVAERIALVQAAEATQMRSWLERRSTRDVQAGEHDHAEPMAGEISRSTIDRAAGLEGAAFDRRFIEAMVPHHRGAIVMAEARLAEPGDPAVARWARAIATAQSLEIDRLREIEARLPSS